MPQGLALIYLICLVLLNIINTATLLFFIKNGKKNFLELTRKFSFKKTENEKKKKACENSRFSSLFPAEDVSRGIASSTQRQKFHTDDVKFVRNPIRSADWSTK